MTHDSGRLIAYVGTYTGSDSRGIYIYHYDPSTGNLDYIGSADGLENPSFLAVHPSRRYLYAVSSIGEYEGQATGALGAYAIEEGGRKLALLNRQPSQGMNPCHVCVDRAGRYVLAANYGSGTLAMLPIAGDGSLQPASAVATHTGASVNPTRQAGPHTHSVTLDAANSFAFAADLGIDRVMIYRLDLDAGKLIPNEAQHFVAVEPGAGPRHFAFHPSGRFAWLINEMGNTITGFAYDAQPGTLREIQTVPTLPAGFSGSSTTADIHVAPSGRFLYGSNRGHDSIVIYRIDDGSGQLAFVGHEPTRGNSPRNFAIDPQGRFLLAANQRSNTIVSFRMDPETGLLAATGAVAEVPSPVCIVLIPAP